MRQIHAFAFFQPVVVFVVKFPFYVLRAVATSGAVFIDEPRLHGNADFIISRLTGHVADFSHGNHTNIFTGFESA